MLEDGNAEVAVALGVEIVEDGVVVCARHADGLLREEAAVGERGHCVAVLLQNLAERGIACFFIIKSQRLKKSRLPMSPCLFAIRSARIGKILARAVRN